MRIAACPGSVARARPGLGAVDRECAIPSPSDRRNSILPPSERQLVSRPTNKFTYTPTPRESEDPPCQTARFGFYRTDDTARLSGHRIAAKPDRRGIRSDSVARSPLLGFGSFSRTDHLSTDGLVWSGDVPFRGAGTRDQTDGRVALRLHLCGSSADRRTGCRCRSARLRFSIRDSFDQLVEERGDCRGVGLFNEPGEGELRRAINAMNRKSLPSSVCTSAMSICTKRSGRS